MPVQITATTLGMVSFVFLFAACLQMAELSPAGNLPPHPQTMWDPGIQIGCLKSKGRFQGSEAALPTPLPRAAYGTDSRIQGMGSSLYLGLLFIRPALREQGREYVLFLYVNKTQNESSLRAPLRSHCYSWHSLMLLLTAKFPHWCFPGASQGPLPVLESCL